MYLLYIYLFIETDTEEHRWKYTRYSKLIIVRVIFLYSMLYVCLSV